MTTDMNAVIEMKEIYKSYGTGEAKVDVLKGISFVIKEGEFVAILGPSGSGKSTLMNIIGFIDMHDSGEYILEGENIKDKTENEYTEIRNKEIGFIFQKFNLISKYTALYNVALPLLVRGENREYALKCAAETLERVGLGDRMHHKPMQLSGGQQQRVAIARALNGNASILLADEPTGALDTKTGQEVIDILKRLNEDGKTIIIITHDLSVAKQAKRIIHVRDGQIYE